MPSASAGKKLKSVGTITDEMMWDALIHSRAEYDGTFFYGVRTTGIFCRPSCRSKIPLRENVSFFPTALEARENVNKKVQP